MLVSEALHLHRTRLGDASAKVCISLSFMSGGGGEGGPLAAAQLHDFPQEAILAERLRRKYILNFPWLIHFLVDSSQTASALPPPVSSPPLASIKPI